MPGLTGEKFSYMALMDARATRIRELEQAQFATQASAGVPSPSGIQGGYGGDDSDDGAPGPSRTQAFGIFNLNSRLSGQRLLSLVFACFFCLFLSFLLGLCISFPSPACC